MGAKAPTGPDTHLRERLGAVPKIEFGFTGGNSRNPLNWTAGCGTARRGMWKSCAELCGRSDFNLSGDTRWLWNHFTELPQSLAAA
jgi:hypothetical protein